MNQTPDDGANAADQTDARVQAADPALTMPDPRIDQIRAKVMAEPPLAEVKPLRRRRTAYIVGGIAAGVALLAGTAVAGAAVGRVTAPASDVVAATTTTSTADEIPVVNAAPNMPSVGRPGAAVNGPGATPGMPGMQAAATEALGAPATSGGAASSSMGVAGSDAKMAAYPYWGGWGTTFTPAPDLVDEPGTATGYRLVSDGVDLKALTAQLGKAFGVKGQPKDMDGAWVVGSEDWTGPAVWVSTDTLVSWSYNDPTHNPWDCANPVPVPAETAGGTATSSDGGEAPVAEPCQPAGKPMSDRDALKQTRQILAGLGVSDAAVDGVDIEWETSSDDYTTNVTAWQRVNGARTQLSWSFSYGEKDLLWASGFAAGLEPVPNMPIVGAATAVTRSQDPKWVSFGPSMVNGGVMPMAMDSTAKSTTGTATTAESASPSAAPITSDATKVQVWWDPITVTGAEPTLAQYWQQDGTMLLLPAYSLTTADDRGEWVVIAIDESAVAFISP